MKMLFALFAVALGAGMTQVHAQEYVCSLTLQSSHVAPQYGRNGYVYINTSFTPGCETVTSKMICSNGATSNLCGAKALYTELALTNVFQALRSSQAAHQKVYPFTDFCVGGGNGTCTQGVAFSPVQ
ncbi:MAG: hypothetical protein ACREPX_00845 [Rhodanobacteraceae bacterium]